MVWPAVERNQGQAQQGKASIRQYTHDVSQQGTIVLEMSKSNFTAEFWEKLSLDNLELAELAANLVTIGEITSELGIQGEVYTTVRNGKTYLVIKGYAGKRATITGTRYLITNPKVAHIMVTPKQILGNALKSSAIMIVAYAAWNAIDAIFKTEDAQLATFLGKTFTDGLKVAASAGVGALSAMAVASATGVAVTAAGPLIVAVLAGIAVGAALDSLDKEFHVTERLIAAIDSKLNEIYNEAMRGPREFNRQWNLWERYLNDSAANGTLNHALRRMFGG